MALNYKRIISGHLSQRTKRLAIAAAALTGVLFVSICGAVYARYVMEKRTADLAEAAGFYLSSDYLRPASENAKYDIYGSDFKVQIFNKENGNSSKMDIEYEVEVTGGTANPADGTLEVSESADTITITPNDGDSTVTVTVRSTSPYIKELTAKFSVNASQDGSLYSYVDNGVYGVLTIHTGSSVGTINVNYGNNLAPNNTEPLLMDWTGRTSNTLTGLEPNSTYKLTFFENVMGDYTTSDIIIDFDSNNAGTISIGN